MLQFLDDHLAEDEFLVGGRYTIADIAVYGYSHRAEEAQLDLEPYPNLRGWFERIESQPGFMEDVEPYGANAAPGAGESIYGSRLGWLGRFDLPHGRRCIEARPVPCRAGTADTRLASAGRTPPRGPSICPCPGRS